VESSLRNTVFEWLLADWAGYGENPAELFPSLQNVSYDELTDELVGAIESAHASPLRHS
jgi:hypothetical protein